MINVTPPIHLDEDEISFQFILASGPGGQNVNKVTTAVQLRFNAAHSCSLHGEVRGRLVKLMGNGLTKQGELLITAKRFRSQERNRQDAIEHLITPIQKAAEEPTQRRRTKPSPAAKQRRLDEKHHRRERKQARRPVKN
ncbi:MAG: alternative ribosome rescue aminoacyl-tRNA hydrolase ArfB [Candidatus Nitrosoglobus sp.]